MGIVDTLKQEMSSLKQATMNAITKFAGDQPKLGQEVSNLVNPERGGLAGLVEQFQAKGLGPIIQSWVGTGPNQPITAQQIMQVLGNEKISQIATRAGLDPIVVSQQLATILPQVINHLTPGGKLPEAAPQPAMR
jgi:uncharacterized protein YidB (DUF937 family)